MLQQLIISNFATIESLNLEFNHGFSVITGETGAGKSIMLDALTLLMGARSETRLIRHGKDSCNISAVFTTTPDSPASKWLTAQGIYNDGTCIIRRVLNRISQDNKCFINDQPVTVTSLGDLGQHLIDIHGQKDHQALLKLPAQRASIDRRAGHEPILIKMRETFREMATVRQSLQQMASSQQAVADRIELLLFQVNELDEFTPLEQQFNALEQDYKRLANAAELGEGMLQVADLLAGDSDNSCNYAITTAISVLNRIQRYDDQLRPHTFQLQSSSDQLHEIANEMRRHSESTSADPESFAKIESRLNQWINLSRKHRIAEVDLPDLHQKLAEELGSLQQAHTAPESLQLRLSELEKNYIQLANQVMNNRIEASSSLCEAVSEQMQLLGMTGGRLEVEIHELPEERYSENGIEHLEFMVTTNPGMPPGSLRKTASGGELSRISLAIEVAAEGASLKPTMMFDEVDAGVGGEIAEIVGDRLRSIGNNAQVISVTHLPQVAAQGHHHFRVKKITDLEASTVHTNVRQLTGEQRRAEIARMLGGRDITNTTLAHAQELLSKAI
ncbi:MAG: DNA repair protein RecN [Arenicellaceae bacterium]|nr:DNA repair protein RecN [Arenicellaceae bacterium]